MWPFDRAAMAELASGNILGLRLSPRRFGKGSRQPGGCTPVWKASRPLWGLAQGQSDSLEEALSLAAHPDSHPLSPLFSAYSLLLPPATSLGDVTTLLTQQPLALQPLPLPLLNVRCRTGHTKASSCPEGSQSHSGTGLDSVAPRKQERSVSLAKGTDGTECHGPGVNGGRTVGSPSPSCSAVTSRRSWTQGQARKKWKEGPAPLASPAPAPGIPGTPTPISFLPSPEMDSVLGPELGTRPVPLTVHFGSGMRHL